MEYADIQKVNQLSQEKNAIQQAIRLFDEGGRITQIGLSPKPVEPPPGTPATPQPPMPFAAVTVPTQYIDYPPQMVDAIKSAFTARQKQITEELEKLGVTGMGEPEKRKR